MTRQPNVPRGRFPPQKRVRKRSEYQEIQATARRVSTSRFVLLLYARDDEKGARLGTIASRKVGIAVIRNRAKRLIREAFRATQELWPADVDLVVVVKRPPGEARLRDVIGDWLEAKTAIESRIREARSDRSLRASRAPGLAKPG